LREKKCDDSLMERQTEVPTPRTVKSKLVDSKKWGYILAMVGGMGLIISSDEMG